MAPESRKFMNVSSNSTSILRRVRLITTAIAPTHVAEAPVHGRADLVPGYRHEAMRQCDVCLIGAGGINGEVGHALVRKGVRSLRIFDADLVELSNLHRQRFFKRDLYENKALALARNLSVEATCATTIEGIPSTFQEACEWGFDGACTIACCGVDNDPTRVFCSRYFFRRGTPCIFIGVSADAMCGYVFVQESRPDSPCWLCLHPDAVNSTDHTPCAAGSTIDILKVVAGLATYAIDSLIMPRRRSWNYKECFLTGDIPERTTRIAKNPDCPACAPKRKEAGKHE
jgi:sulfur carrier protein ThiS adenylyltransferase